jgi:hypothetical protein
MFVNIFITFLFILLFTLVFYLLFTLSNSNIQILSKNELLNILLSDDDGYYKTFNDTDFKVRNSINIQHYKENIKYSVCSPNNKVIKKLYKAISKSDLKINNLCKNYNYNYHGIDLNKLKNIKWKIGIICNKKYENGLPHTRNDTIIISTSQIMNSNLNDLSTTLVHEKVHLFQKKFKNETQRYLKNKQYIIIDKINKNDNIRANPDTDNNIYVDNLNRTYKAEYLPDAVDIQDVKLYKNNQTYEHPLEAMAIEISKESNI